jgi:hypothetical protein
MNRLIYSVILSCLFFTGNGATGRTKTIPTASHSKLSKDISNEDGLTKTHVGSTDIQSDQNDGLKNNISLKSKFSQIKVNPSVGSSEGGCNNDDYFVEISGACFGNGWDITSVTICGVEVCRIIMQTSNLVVVYPNSGTPGTGDIVIASESLGKTTIKNGFTYQVPSPKDQAKNIQFLNIGPNSADISWIRGSGESCIVFMKEANTGSTTPVDRITYESGIVFGDGTQIGSTGWYCVYNGTGTSVSVSGLVPGKDYVVQVFEYNGHAGFETYLDSTSTDNPKKQEPIVTKDRINSDSFSKNSSVTFDHSGTININDYPDSKN